MGFDKPRHDKFWKRCSTLLPEDYTAGDGARMSLGFFIVAALDLLGILGTAIPEPERRSWVDWIYSCQLSTGGFRGFPGTNFGPAADRPDNRLWDPANLPNTYLALMTLLVLGDDLGRLKRGECLGWVKRMQRDNGSFGEFLGEDGRIEGKDDLRQCYCAAGICYILQLEMDDFPKPVFDEEKLVGYISNCQDHDGGFGQSPLREAHSGMNFCAIAALSCLDRLRQCQSTTNKSIRRSAGDIEKNMDWILNRQTTWVEDADSSSDDEEQEQEQRDDQSNSPSEAKDSNLGHKTGVPVGFNGRCGKIADTCYCFWNSGALSIMNKGDLVNSESMRQYLLEKVQHTIGGFSKVPGERPDLLHSYLGLAALALYHEPGLKAIDSTLCVSEGAVTNIGRTAWQQIRRDKTSSKPPIAKQFLGDAKE